MDKSNKRNETIDKKNDYRIKDRGDLKKCNDKTLKKSEGITQMKMNLAFPECGDAVRKLLANQKSEKIKLNVSLKKPTNDDSKMKYLISGTTEMEFLNKNNYDKDKLAKSHSELRKRIRDRYTLKLNGPVNKSDHVSFSVGKREDGRNGAPLKTDGDNHGLPVIPPSVPAASLQKQMSEESTQTVEKSKPASAASTKSDPDKKREKTPTKPDKILAKLVKEENRLAKRKPIIKTITSKNGPVRIFKAVTFVDQNHPTPLEIKIPGQITKTQQKLSKYTETSSLNFKPKITVSKVSSSKPSISSKQTILKPDKLTKLAAVRKRAERRRDRKFRRGRSPGGSIKELPSPPTEVARWAPASVEPQTIPYYEAWINTTLAAITKTTKQDRINYEKQAKLLMNFQKALEDRPTSPELFYANCADEKYTGRIKVRQTERSRKKQLTRAE